MLSAGESSEDEYYDGEDDGEELMTCDFICLFCDSHFSDIASLSNHSTTVHQINIINILGSLSFYNAVKLINYTRDKHLSPDEFRTQSEQTDLDENYMKPTIPDDTLLMIDFEELALLSAVNASNDKGKQKQSKPTELELHYRIQELESQLAEMKVMYISLLDQQASPKHALQDETYFNSYSDYSIHSEMLQDKSRTDTYRDFVYKNPKLFIGKRVLDVGCGTGILSLFAAKAGAASVVAVDNSDIAEKAKVIVKINQLHDRINVIRGRIEDINVCDSYDVIISEWMGYGMLFECMLDSVIIARNNHMSPTGTMIPNRASMYISAISDEASYKKRISFWSNVYEFDMTAMKENCLRIASVHPVSPTSVISTACGFKHFDLNLVQVEHLEFSSEIEISITKPAKMTGITIYFTCFFDGPQFSAVLDTSPEAPLTHWLQTTLFLHEVLAVEKGDSILGSITFKKCSQVKRGYIIGINAMVTRQGTQIASLKHHYHLN